MRVVNDCSKLCEPSLLYLPAISPLYKTVLILHILVFTRQDKTLPRARLSGIVGCVTVTALTVDVSTGWSVFAEDGVPVVSIGATDVIVAVSCLGLTVILDVTLGDSTVDAFSFCPDFSVVTISSVEMAEIAVLDSCPGFTDVVRSSVVCCFIVVVISSLVVVGSLLGIVRPTVFGSAPVVVCFTGSRVSVDFTFFVEMVESTEAAVTMTVTFSRCRY